MSKKGTLILLSILHICILGICILTIYSNRNRASEVVIAHVSSETKTMESQTEPAAETEPGTGTEPGTEMIAETEPAAETEPDTGAESETEAVSETENTSETNTEAEASPVYSFHYTGMRANLNIRSAPSTDDAIIGKVPCGGDGTVLELTDDAWALIDYQGVIGYCSRAFLELREIDN